RRSNSRLPTTLNARDQPPAEVSDQRVSGLTGAVQFISDLRCCTRTWYRYIQGPSGPRIPRPPVPNIDDPINLRPLSPGQVNKVWLWQSLPGPWIGSARNTVYLTGFEFLEP
ncbi:hypothetical protein, partial [Mycobacterium tuberculosis]|uniref:hypothetical protein n=1 Tax=Mycobacterium tuberculosis TaxID=1773 RepID=UPI000A53DFC3